MAEFYLSRYLMRSGTESEIDSNLSKQHKQLLNLNRCNVHNECVLIRGAVGIECYYLVEKTQVSAAKKILQSIGKKNSEECIAVEYASGIVCSNNKCMFGEGPMSSMIEWNN